MREEEEKNQKNKKTKKQKQRETQVKGNHKTRNGGTRTPNEVRQQTSVTCVEYLLSTRGWLLAVQLRRECKCWV